MSLSCRVIIVAALAVVTFRALAAAPTADAQMATDPMPYAGAGAASCTHPLFVILEYAAGDAPQSVAIGDLDGVNGPDLAVANLISGDVSVLLNLCVGAPLEFIRGECNDDGSMDIADGIFLVQFLFLDGPEPPCRAACDANRDGMLNVADAMFIWNYRLVDGPPPPSPFPDCGTAPDEECNEFMSCP